MKNKHILFLLAVLSLIPGTGLYGQKAGGKMTIEGKVVIDVHGEKLPVANAIILIDGKNTGIFTNREGMYKVRVKKETEKISVCIGDDILEDRIGGKNHIDFTYTGSVPYQPVNEDGNEVIDIGYQQVRKRDNVFPVDKIDGEKLKNSHYDNIYEMIRGKVPGVSVSGNSILIRSAVSTMGTEPLFVVDGVPVNTIGDIDPQMVRSIELLKGAAASIYGTRGSNGVILINLKKGNDK